MQQHLPVSFITRSSSVRNVTGNVGPLAVDELNNAFCLTAVLQIYLAQI